MSILKLVVSLQLVIGFFDRHSAHGFVVAKVGPNEMTLVTACARQQELAVYTSPEEVNEWADFAPIEEDATMKMMVLVRRRPEKRPLAECQSPFNDVESLEAAECDRSYCSWNGECNVRNEGTSAEMYECICDDRFYGNRCQDEYPGCYWMTGLAWLLWIFPLLAVMLSQFCK